MITEVSEMLWNRTAGLCGLLDGVERDLAFRELGLQEATQLASERSVWRELVMA